MRSPKPSRRVFSEWKDLAGAALGDMSTTVTALPCFPRAPMLPPASLRPLVPEKEVAVLLQAAARMPLHTQFGLSSSFSVRGDSVPQGTLGPNWGHDCLPHLQVVDSAGMWWVGMRDAAQHPTGHRTPHSREPSNPNARRADGLCMSQGQTERGDICIYTYMYM